MWKIEKWSAIELQQEIDRAEHYAEDSGTALLEALREVERLRGLCQEVIEIINTSVGIGLSESEILTKAEDTAQEYYKP